MYAKESAHGATRDSVGVVNHQPEKIALVVCCSCIFHPRSSINPGIQRTDFRSASTMNSGESERVINIFRCIFNFIETYLIFTKFSLGRDDEDFGGRFDETLVVELHPIISSDTRIRGCSMGSQGP